MSDYTTQTQEKTNPHLHLNQRETKRNEKVRKMYKTGWYTYRKLARIFHISPTRIEKIVNHPDYLEENHE